MTSRGSRRRLLSGSELKERGRREAPLSCAELTYDFALRIFCRMALDFPHDQNLWASLEWVNRGEVIDETVVTQNEAALKFPSNWIVDIRLWLRVVIRS